MNAFHLFGRKEKGKEGKGCEKISKTKKGCDKMFSNQSIESV
jgi:hypothetical protein